MEGFSLVVVAAGRGERAGGDSPKQYRRLGGRMVWEWSALLAESLFAEGIVRQVVFVVPPGDEPLFGEKLSAFSFPFSVTAGVLKEMILFLTVSGARQGTLFSSTMEPDPSREKCCAGGSWKR